MSRTAESCFDTWICDHHSECRAGFTPGSSRCKISRRSPISGHVHVHVLIDFRPVDLDVNLLWLFARRY